MAPPSWYALAMPSPHRGGTITVTGISSPAPGARRAAADAGVPVRLGAGQLSAPGGVAGNHHGVASCPGWVDGADSTARL
jgi:hypothetical protein